MEKPRYKLTLSGKEYELEGSFGLIEKVEYTLDSDIISVIQSCLDMPVYKIAKLLSAILNHCGHDLKKERISEIITEEMGIASSEFALLRFHLFAFLKICICKPSDRAQVKKDMGELIGKLEAPSASLGENTSNFV